jgi:DNA-binding NarL/FixJ family response regulator
MIVALAALVTALAMASLTVSFYALYRAHKLFHTGKMNASGIREECAAAIEAAQSRFNAVAEELKTMKSQTPIEILPGLPKPGMNLTRRSHALRLHRKGNTPAQIAAALEVPRQEVELLLKVHELVLNNL